MDDPSEMAASRVQGRRRDARVRYKLLFDQAVALFFRIDPVGINFDVNTDEYEPEVATVLPRLLAADSEKAVRTILSEEFNHWFGLDRARGDRLDALAEELWRLRSLWTQAEAP